MPLKAIALNCTLKPEGESSTDAMIAVLKDAFAKATSSDRDGPRRRARHQAGRDQRRGRRRRMAGAAQKILAHDILIFAGPIWMGQIGSVAKRVLERMDAFLSETDDAGPHAELSKVAVAAIVGNEDGAHFSTAQIFQSLNDTGWTIPAVGAIYWVGEAYGDVDFKDLKRRPRRSRRPPRCSPATPRIWPGCSRTIPIRVARCDEARDAALQHVTARA